ncbi:MAG: proline--tRNA ligase [Candidatus Omnitrophica bacterium]|nr:proline--tRNA ligase [Candidatus Omnitrophota bacterium]MCM8831266.1 proline--tRNA ligase [Candidatus Omnitrophota bacterium]
MLFSKSFIHTLRKDPKIAECKSHKLLLKGCFIYMVSSGIYAYLPLGYKVLDKISNIVRKYMNKYGASEVLLSVLQPLELWEKTKRDQALKDIMFKFKDRKNRTLCLGPTHEEEITDIVSKYVFSYKQLPTILYQIQTKFRDEPRPRFGLLRNCEFIMKDAYSFDKDTEGLDISYQKMRQAYQEIFKSCSLNFITIEAESGFMGGSVSEEFLVQAEIGEDVLFYCNECNGYFREQKTCTKCKKPLEEKHMIELGHIFKLGTKYSLAQQAFFLDKDGKRQPIIMGCYGIGVSRLLSAIVEQNCDEKGIIWPKSIAPFDISLVVLEDSLLTEALSLEEFLKKENLEVLIDDRQEQAGVKFNDALLIGNPYIFVLGKNYIKSKKIDVEVRKTGEKFSLDKNEIPNFLKKD